MGIRAVRADDSDRRRYRLGNAKCYYVKEIVSCVTSCFPLRAAPPMGSQERSAA